MWFNRRLKYTAFFSILAFVLFLLSGGIFVLFGQNPGSSGLVNRPSGLQFVYPGDVNNLTPQQSVVGSLVLSLGISALVTFLLIGLFRTVHHDAAQIETKRASP